MGKSAAHVAETATMIREVKAFGLESRMIDAYDALLRVPSAEARSKSLAEAGGVSTTSILTNIRARLTFSCPTAAFPCPLDVGGVLVDDLGTRRGRSGWRRA
jgi:hypothetical protein